jgi:hypothetical protein
MVTVIRPSREVRKGKDTTPRGCSLHITGLPVHLRRRLHPSARITWLATISAAATVKLNISKIVIPRSL